MNILKHLIMVSLLVLGANFWASAQGILSPEQQEEIAANVEQFIKEINLSERDKPQFQMILGDFFIGLVALRATDFSPKTNRKIFKALKKGRDSRMKDFLNKEQYKIYKAQVKEIRTNLITYMEQQQK